MANWQYLWSLSYMFVSVKTACLLPRTGQLVILCFWLHFPCEAKSRRVILNICSCVPVVFPLNTDNAHINYNSPTSGVEVKLTALRSSAETLHIDRFTGEQVQSLHNAVF